MAISEKEFLRRRKAAKAERSKWQSILEEAYDLFLPNRQTERFNTRGNNRFTKLYDSTGVDSLAEWADTIKQGLMPSNQNWAVAVPSGKIDAEVELGKASKSDRDELARQLEIITKICFKYIHASNFDQAMHESLQDCAISTGALYVLDGGSVDEPLVFVSVPSFELAYESDSKGGVSGVYRDHSIACGDIYEMFPKAEKDAVLDKLIEENSRALIDVCEGIIWDSAGKIWQYIVYIKKAERKVFFKDTYEVSPACIFRTSVSSGEVMGRGVALNALPTMRTLNKLEAQLIYNNEMAIKPPLIMDTNMSILDPSNVRLSPESILPVQYGFDGNASAFKFLETSGARFNVGDNMKTDYQNRVRGMFALPMLGSVTDPTKSATEMSIRNQQALSRQGAMYGRLSQEAITAVMVRVHYILSTYDIVPKELKFGDSAVSIKATSSLAKIQDRAELEGLLNYEQYMMSKGEMGMAMMASTIDIEAANVFTAEKMGVPAHLKLDDNQRKQAFQQLQQAAQSQVIQQQGGGVEGV